VGVNSVLGESGGRYGEQAVDGGRCLGGGMSLGGATESTMEILEIRLVINILMIWVEWSIGKNLWSVHRWWEVIQAGAFLGVGG